MHDEHKITRSSSPLQVKKTQPSSVDVTPIFSAGAFWEELPLCTNERASLQSPKRGRPSQCRGPLDYNHCHVVHHTLCFLTAKVARAF